MKRKLSILLMTALALSGCHGTPVTESESDGMTIVATTYPIYLFANAVTTGVDGIKVERLDTGSTSCLHDYTLSVDDMKRLEGADLIAINGVELEEFMEDALATSQAVIADCSQYAVLLERVTHDHVEEGYDQGHYDPHIWLSQKDAQGMIDVLSNVIQGMDEEHRERYEANAIKAQELIRQGSEEARAVLDGIEDIKLITFHDGFQYFASSYGMELLKSIEEEAGSEASAKEILEITDMVNTYHLPGIFTEINGSDATAKAIARETGCQVGQLTMLMDGAEEPANGETGVEGWIGLYLDGIMDNVTAIATIYAEQ